MSAPNHDFDLRAWARNPVNLLTTLMIWGGLFAAITTQTSWPIAILGAGLLGPTLLRELGLMRWEDEFQREVMVRAALHAFLAVGAALTAIMAINGFSGTYSAEMKDFEDAVPASTLLALLALVWYLSRLLQYWGARKAAFRIWGGVGLVWLGVVLVAMATLAPMRADLSLTSILQRCVPAAPLLVLAWLSIRWPRVAGATGLAFLAWWLLGTGLWRTFDSGMPWEMTLDVAMLILVPIAAPAVALLAARTP